MSPKLERKPCEGTRCRDTAFFRPPSRKPAGGDPFFKPLLSAAGDAPALQRQEAPQDAEKEKSPLLEGLTIFGGKVAENEQVKELYKPWLNQVKLTLWGKASRTEKAAMLSFLGLNLGLAGTAFGLEPKLRRALSDVNIGKLLSLIPWSPIEGFKYKLPEAGKTATEFSADFTLNPYLAELRKRRGGGALSGATFGLESSYEAGKGLSVTGGKFGLELFDGGLKAEGKTFNELSPYPLLLPGRDGVPASMLMQQTPGLPMIKTGPGFEFMLNADLLKLFPWLRKTF